MCSIVLTVEGFREFRELGWKFGRPFLLTIAVPFVLLSWLCLLLYYFLAFTLNGDFTADLESLSAVSFKSVSSFVLAVNVVPMIVFLYGYRAEGEFRLDVSCLLAYCVPDVCMCRYFACTSSQTSTPSQSSRCSKPVVSSRGCMTGRPLFPARTRPSWCTHRSTTARTCLTSTTRTVERFD